MIKTKIMIAFGLVCASTSAYTQEHTSPLETLDSDGNGSVSFAEFQENGFNMLARIDADENGVLTLDELLNAGPGPRPRRGDHERNSDSEGDEQSIQAERKARMTERVTQTFQDMDRDGDDVVSASEFNEANFLRMDKDNNGSLSADELRPPRGQRGRGRRGERTPPA